MSLTKQNLHPILKYPHPLQNRKAGAFCSDAGVIWCAISPFYSDWPPFFRNVESFCISFGANLCEIAQKRSDISPFCSDVWLFYLSIASFYRGRLSFR